MTSKFEEWVQKTRYFRSNAMILPNSYNTFRVKGTRIPITTLDQARRAAYIAKTYPLLFRVFRYEGWGEHNVWLVSMADPVQHGETEKFVKHGESVVYGPDSSIVGYTHSDGYCLCVKHGTTIKWDAKEEHYFREELEDDGNETGHVYPIFEYNETDNEKICDPCFDKLFRSGGDVKESIILAQNIGLEEGEEDEEEEGSDEESES